MLRRLIGLLIGLFFMIKQMAVPPVAPADDARLQHFYYQYGGMILPLFTGIDAEMTPDGWVATFLLGPQDDVEGVDLSDQDVAVLEELMEEYKLWTWADFHESNPNMLDGENFSFSASYTDGTRIDAHGSNAFPAEYWTAKEAILSAIEEMLIAHDITYRYD